MKKILLLFTCFFCFTGCNLMKDINNTPTRKVEELLNRYQTLHADVLKDLDKAVAEEELFNNEQRESYKNIMKKHYQNLTYEIKQEEINADHATVKAEITVTDYTKALQDASTYLRDHPEEFTDESGEYDASLFTNYRLEQIKNVKDKVTYTLDIQVTKKDDRWVVDSLPNSTIDKIHGIYTY